MICEQMGIEPKEEDIPINPSVDFCLPAQQALHLYHILPDIIDGMSGTWHGKHFSGIGDILEIYQVDDKREVFDYLIYMIQIVRKCYAEVRERESKLKK